MRIRSVNEIDATRILVSLSFNSHRGCLGGGFQFGFFLFLLRKISSAEDKRHDRHINHRSDIAGLFGLFVTIHQYLKIVNLKEFPIKSILIEMVKPINNAGNLDCFMLDLYFGIRPGAGLA